MTSQWSNWDQIEITQSFARFYRVICSHTHWLYYLRGLKRVCIVFILPCLAGALFLASLPSAATFAQCKSDVSQSEVSEVSCAWQHWYFNSWTPVFNYRALVSTESLDREPLWLDRLSGALRYSIISSHSHRFIEVGRDALPTFTKLTSAPTCELWLFCLFAYLFIFHGSLRASQIRKTANFLHFKSCV